MKTMAPQAPTSHTSARCSASTPGAAVIAGREPPAVAAYAITYSRNVTLQNSRHCERSEAIQSFFVAALACFASLAMTAKVDFHQYAFSFFVISAIGVFIKMKRSNSTDQFSM